MAMEQDYGQFVPAKANAKPGELSVSQVAELLGITGAAVRQHIAKGTLPAERRNGVWFIREKDESLIQGLKSGFPRGRKREKQRGRKI